MLQQLKTTETHCGHADLVTHANSTVLRGEGD